jgi:uncharacterized protein (DUF3084 family)
VEDIKNIIRFQKVYNGLKNKRLELQSLKNLMMIKEKELGEKEKELGEKEKELEEQKRKIHSLEHRLGNRGIRKPDITKKGFWKWNVC